MASNVPWYGDNVTFSGNAPLGWIRRVVERFAAREGFGLKRGQAAPRHKRQEVTKLVVNAKVNVPREYVRQLRYDLLRCLRHGPEVMAPTRTDWLNSRLRGRTGYVRGINASRAASLMRVFNRIRWPRSSGITHSTPE